MDIVLNRRGGVPVKDQLRFQLEMKILAGELAPGQKLPSVRALARRLDVHPNTVSAAYKDLQATRHVEMQRGSGIYVRPGAPAAPEEARGLDEMIRLALYLAFRSGYSGAEIRAAVERWLAAAPPDRIVIVDPSAEMGELLVHEVKSALKLPATSCALEEIRKDPSRISGALVLTLPYHLETVSHLAPGTAIEPLTLEVAPETRQAIMDLPEGAIVVVVSHSPTVLPFASVFLRSLRGDQIYVETCGLAAGREWKRLVPAADLVCADTLAIGPVRQAKPKRLLEVRLIPDGTVARLRDALMVVAPRHIPVDGQPPASRAAAAKTTKPRR
jgi:GntR family transcriptional regulator